MDLGAKRIGLALSDPTRTVASPHSVLLRGRSHEVDHRAIVATAREADATAIVVGLPLSLSGREGPAAQAALVEVDELRNVAGPDFEVTVHDERLTTVIAERALREARMKRRCPAPGRRQGRGRGDAPVLARKRREMNGGESTATRSDADRRHRRRVWTVVAMLVLIPVVVFGSMAAWFVWQLDPPGKSGETVEVRVDDGWGVSRIGDELVDRGVIGSSLVFSVYSRLKSNSDFQAGTYRLKHDMGVRNAVAALEAGPHIDYTELAVPPGLQVSEVASRVGELPGPER